MADPLGYMAGDANMYRYCSNRPTGCTDPLGLFCGYSGGPAGASMPLPFGHPLSGANMPGGPGSSPSGPGASNGPGGPGGGGDDEGAGYYHPLGDQNAPVSSEYGPRSMGPHRGIDYAVPECTPVYAVCPGTIIRIREQGDEGYGNAIYLSNGENVFVYSHLESIEVELDREASSGDFLGYSGNTGLIFPPFDGHGDKVYIRHQEVSGWEVVDVNTTSNLRLRQYV
jgi:hypothetical protein